MIDILNYMNNNIISKIVSELLTEKLGESWKLELAKKGSKFSYASKRNGTQSWASSMAKKLLKKSEDYEFIGIFSESDSSEGPILEGVVYFCTEYYIQKSPYMYFEKKDACKKTSRTNKPTYYIEG